MGRLGMPYTHQCWGRDLLALGSADPGFGVIKPSGSDQTVAIVAADKVLVQPPGQAPSLFRYRLNESGEAERLEDAQLSDSMRHALESYIQTATQSLLLDSAGTE